MYGNGCHCFDILENNEYIHDNNKENERDWNVYFDHNNIKVIKENNARYYDYHVK